MKEWMKELQKIENNKYFSELVHEYYKLANMRIMQKMREKFNIPSEDIAPFMISVFARMLNESCYSLGSHIREDYPITNIYSKDHLLNLLKVLNGESLSQFERTDIDMDIDVRLQKFKKFVMENGKDL
jgi:hypothetical protein